MSWDHNMVFDHPIWENIALQLASTYGSRIYFTPETMIQENILDPLVVTQSVSDFFGTRPLNLVIVGRPAGWSKDGDGIWQENWPPPGLDDAKAKHIATYDQFTKYETHIWTDFIFVNTIMDENPDSRIEEMMNALDARLTDLCSELAAYGFTYHGKIESEVEENFFHSVIDTFLATPEA